jgi:hypothetical protein
MILSCKGRASALDSARLRDDASCPARRPNSYGPRAACGESGRDSGRPRHDRSRVRAIEPVRHPDLEPLDATRQRLRVLRLAHQKHMVRLDIVVHDPQAEPLRASPDGAPEHATTPAAAQPRRVAAQLERDMHRITERQRFALAVRHARLACVRGRPAPWRRPPCVPIGSSS